MTAFIATPPAHQLPAVISTTREIGWPHSVQPDETDELTNVMIFAAPPNVRAMLCRFGPTTGHGYCGIIAGGRRFRLDVKVWEDGSYRVYAPHRGAK